MIELLVGIAAGILTIVLARAIDGQRWFYSLGLLVLPSLYALFALVVGDRTAGAMEMIYGIPFVAAGLAFTFFGARLSAIAVGLFWVLHAMYDLAHDRFVSNAGVPGWYPVWCCAVDVVVGAYLLWLAARIPDANLRAARVFRT